MFEFTKREIEKMQKRELMELIQYAGDQVHLARMVGVSQPTVMGWANRGKISKQGAMLVESHPGLSRKFTAIQLRPDLTLTLK